MARAETGTAPAPGRGWIVAAVKIPASPSRHRVAVWRELRRTGAVVIGPSVWAVPDVPACAQGIARVAELAAAGGGELLLLNSTGRTLNDAARLESLFAAAREADWAEFIADCGKFEDELDREIANDKLTMAELEEEEQSLDRLRRWHRDLRMRDVFDVPAAATALARLRDCNDRLDAYADLVYIRVQQE